MLTNIWYSHAIEYLLRLATTPEKNIVVVTGPAASGKTTMLNVLDQRLAKQGVYMFQLPDGWEGTLIDYQLKQANTTLPPPLYDGETEWDRYFRLLEVTDPVVWIGGDYTDGDRVNDVLERVCRIRNYRLIVVAGITDNAIIRVPGVKEILLTPPPHPQAIVRTTHGVLPS